MKRYSLVLCILFGLVLYSCQKKDETQPTADAKMGNHVVIVEEVLQANAYTYLNVKEGSDQYWIAITSRAVEKGETLFFDNRMEMQNFESKDLQRTFDTIYFVDSVSNRESSQQFSDSPHGSIGSTGKENLTIEPIKGGTTIGELFANRDSYADKTVKIKGKVVKFNQGILGKNWAHIQDGTEDAGKFDLTITTNDVVAVGDIVVFEGKVGLNKDFGAGYTYEVIVEEASTVKDLPKS